MKIAIHSRENSFSDRWIEYCQSQIVPYILVDCHSTDIITKLKKEKVTHLMWHFSHGSFTDVFIYNNVLNSADNLGIKTFPNFETRWHFDDKIAQKYLLESVNAPLIDSHVFYSKNSAEKFIDETSFPIVAKLRRGAGAANVRLLNNKEEAYQYINIMFTTGIAPISSVTGNLSQKFRIAKKIKNPFDLLLKFKKFLNKNKVNRTLFPSEKGYVYLQKFLPDNSFDTRIIVAGNKAFGIRRFNRKNDFRASGSGKIDFTATLIDTKMVEIAFEVTENIKGQCLAFDFVYENGIPKIIEVCFGFSMLAYDPCEGYWDRELTFHQGKFNPQYFMIENLLQES